MADYSNILGYGTSSGAGITGLADPLQITASFDPTSLNGLGMGAGDLVAVPSIPGLDTGGLFGTGITNQDAQLGLSALGSLANIYNSFQANSLAKKQLKLQTNMANANYANSISAYNTTLSDRLNSRGKVEGTSQADTDAAIAAASLKERTL